MSASLANDKLSIPHRFTGGNSTLSSRVTANGFSNVIQADEVSFASGDGDLSALTFYGENGPGTDYDSYAKVGDKYIKVTFSSGVPATVAEYIRTANGWQTYIMGGDTLAAVTASTAGELARIWGTNSATSGTIRGISVRTAMTGSGTQDGEALRAYTLISGTITGSGVHGAHITAQIGDESVASTANCTGEVAGVRATIGIGLTNTAPVGGTIAALRLDSYFQSTGNGASSSFIYACDVGSFGIKTAFLQIGTLVNAQSAKANYANGPYTYESGGMTPSNLKGALKVITPDGAFYIPLYMTLA